ncbi:MAG: hypothetical protein K2O30_04065 [Duncaniella sp.]|nr:hypothetical protein [Duncaniella sp.]
MGDNKDFQDNILSLRREVERKANRAVKTPADFEFLSEAINALTHLTVSPSTLKRVWGYINDVGASYRPGNYTLRALARYVGYLEFEDFVHRKHGGDVQSDFYFGDMVESVMLPKNAYVLVTWRPDRKCVMKHLFDTHFEVVEAHNSKIMTGDIVTCSFFVQNAPMYVNSIRREGVASMSYIAGTNGGVRFEVLDPKTYEEPEREE